MRHFFHKVSKYSCLLGKIFQCSLINSLEYKSNFFFGGVFELLWMIMYIIFFNVIFMNTSAIAGWSLNEILILVFFGGLADALFTFLFVGGLIEFPSLVNEGTLDFVLLKPVNKQFYISFKYFSFPQIFNVIINIGAIIFLLVTSHVRLSLSKIIMFIILGLNGFFIIYCIMFLLMVLSFWVIRMDVVQTLGPELITIGNKPMKVYPTFLQKIFTYIIPIFVAFNFPTMYLVKQLELGNVILAFVISIIFYIFTQIVLKLGLKKYHSASS